MNLTTSNRLAGTRLRGVILLLIGSYELVLLPEWVETLLARGNVVPLLVMLKMNYLNITKLLKEDNIEELDLDNSKLRYNIDSYQNFEGGYFTDVAASIGDDCLIRHLPPPSANDYMRIPFPGSGQWSLEYYYCLFDFDVYKSDADTPHGPFFAHGYHYLEDSVDFIHIVVHAYDRGVNEDKMREQITEEGRQWLLKSQLELNNTHRQLLDFLLDVRPLPQPLSLYKFFSNTLWRWATWWMKWLM